jgi:hypothetical protein
VIHFHPEPSKPSTRLSTKLLCKSGTNHRMSRLMQGINRLIGYEAEATLCCVVSMQFGLSPAVSELNVFCSLATGYANFLAAIVRVTMSDAADASSNGRLVEASHLAVSPLH